MDPQDIFFATRANGKLCRLGKGAFGTVSSMVPRIRLLKVLHIECLALCK